MFADALIKAWIHPALLQGTFANKQMGKVYITYLVKPIAAGLKPGDFTLIDLCSYLHIT